MTREVAIKHKDVIAAFIDGKEIQFKNSHDVYWLECINPQFNTDYEYRIKPERPCHQPECRSIQIQPGAPTNNRGVLAYR